MSPVEESRAPCWRLPGRMNRRRRKGESIQSGVRGKRLWPGLFGRPNVMSCSGGLRPTEEPHTSLSSFTIPGSAGIACLKPPIRFCMCLRIIVLTKAPLPRGCISGRLIFISLTQAKVSLVAVPVTYDSRTVHHQRAGLDRRLPWPTYLLKAKSHSTEHVCCNLYAARLSRFDRGRSDCTGRSQHSQRARRASCLAPVANEHHSDAIRRD